MEDLTGKLNSILGKMNNLLEQYVKLQEENIYLKNELDQLQTDLKDRNNQKTELEEKLKTLQIAKSVDLEDDKGALKQKINDYIKEIDRCIALLND